MRTRQESSCIGATNASATTIIEYLVDGMGRRVGKKVNGTVTKKWLWRSQLQPVAELDANNNVVQRYVYTDGVNVPDQIITATATYRLIKDHLGSVRLVVDEATGSVVQQIDYDSWGRVLTDTNSGFQPFGFAGGLYDPDTGLVRFGARDYDPEIGRWTAKDPKRFSDSGNLYEYSRSDCVNHRDPTGLTVYECCGGTQTGRFLGPLNADHCWVCTDSVCAGLSGSLFDTEVERHNDSYTSFHYPGYTCEPIGGADEECVSAVLNDEIGRHYGAFSPWNNCRTYADDVFEACTAPDADLGGVCEEEQNACY